MLWIENHNPMAGLIPEILKCWRLFDNSLPPASRLLRSGIMRDDLMRLSLNFDARLRIALKIAMPGRGVRRNHRILTAIPGKYQRHSTRPACFAPGRGEQQNWGASNLPQDAASAAAI